MGIPASAKEAEPALVSALQDEADQFHTFLLTLACMHMVAILTSLTPNRCRGNRTETTRSNVMASVGYQAAINTLP
eukprot:scaffold87122_cov32-Prasinocladus_malaysianus.AAC.1